MLILSRKKEQGLVIRDKNTGGIICRIILCGPGKGQVQLGIVADIDAYEVNRDELDKTKYPGDYPFNK